MQLQHILKRDGRVVAFDRAKIAAAIAAAGRGTGELDADVAQALTGAVIEALAAEGNVCPGVETIQNQVEETLVKAGHYPTARAYMVYRERHGRLRRERKTLVDVAASMNEYLSRADWRVRANANQGYSLGGLILNVSGKVTANYWLDEVYDADIAAAHRDADLHIHDLDMLAGYCAGWSLRTLLNEGLNGVPGRVEAGVRRSTCRQRPGADGQLPRHPAERVGRGPGLQLLRHLPGALRAQGPPRLRQRAPGPPGVHLQPQRAVALGHPDALHQPDLRLGLPGRPARAGAPHRRRGDALRLRRAAGRDGPDQPRLHRGDAGRRRPRPGVHLPDPDLQHHPRLPLGQRQRHAPVRDDRALRPALLPELPQLGHAAQPGALDVLPPATGRARAAQARQRPVRLGGADRLAGRGDDQLRAPGLPPRGDAAGPLPPSSTTCWNWPSTAWSSSAR